MNRVLIVDDSPIDRKLISGLLGRNDQLEIATADDGAEALLAIDATPPDLVITDMLMPQLDGLELVRLLAKSAPHIPVVLTTSRGTEELAVKALESGAASYVPKSRLATDLEQVCEKVLGAARHRAQNRRLMQALVSQSCTFEVGPDPTLFRPLVRYIQSQLDHFGFGEEQERTRVALALEEAINNAHEHGNLELDSQLREDDFEGFIGQLHARAVASPYRERRIRLESVITGEEVQLTVEDEGAGFDPATLPDPRDPENLERATGRGILLMRTFMDEVSFKPPGNRVEMRRRASGIHRPRPQTEGP